MKRLLLFIVLLVMGSCLPTRTVTKTIRDVSEIQTGVIDRQIPGATIIVEAPRTPDTRVIDTTIIYRGDHGATTTVDYGADGEIDKVISDCPEITEREKYDRETETKIRDKTSKREFNEFFIKEAKSTVLYLGGMFCIAWAIVGVFRVR